MPSGGIPISLDPTLFQAGPVLVTWHGLFTAIGTLVGIWLAIQWATRAGFSEDDTISVAMWGVVGGVIGARVFHVLDQWSYYAANPLQIVMINQGGLSIYGAIVGGFLAGGIYVRFRKLNLARFADVACVPLVLGMAIGRIGDVMSGEQHGAHAQGFPLAFVYTNPNTLGELNVPVHLAVGYELIVDLVVFGVLVWMTRGIVRRDGKPAWNWSPRTRWDGMVFWTFLALYSIGRFVVQFYRADPPFLFGLSQAQLLAVVFTMVSVWIVVYRTARAGRVHPTAATTETAPAV